LPFDIDHPYARVDLKLTWISPILTFETPVEFREALWSRLVD